MRRAEGEMVTYTRYASTMEFEGSFGGKEKPGNESFASFLPPISVQSDENKSRGKTLTRRQGKVSSKETFFFGYPRILSFVGRNEFYRVARTG